MLKFIIKLCIIKLIILRITTSTLEKILSRLKIACRQDFAILSMVTEFRDV